MSKLMTSIVVYGEIDDTSEIWQKWVNFCTELAQKTTNNIEYVGVKGDGFNNSDVVRYDNIKQKLSHAITNQKSFESISMYSLPENFRQAAFDYDIYISRVRGKRASYVLTTISNEIILKEKVNLVDLKEHISKFVNKEKGIIFEMDINEFPPKYIMGKGKDTNFRTLKVFEEF
jgi:hypothetical protein